MKKLEAKQEVKLKIEHVKGEVAAVNVMVDSEDISDHVFEIILSATDEPLIEISNYIRDADGKVVKTYKPDGECSGVEEETRTFTFSGKIDIRLEEEIIDEDLHGKE